MGSDEEVGIIALVVAKLSRLDKATLRRVLRYLCDRFDFDPSAP